METVVEETESVDMYAIWEAANFYDDATDPLKASHEKPELCLEHDLQMALALCPGTPKIVDIRSKNTEEQDPKKTAIELAQRVLEAHKSNDASATVDACAKLRTFLLQYRVELDVE